MNYDKMTLVIKQILRENNYLERYNVISNFNNIRLVLKKYKKANIEEMNEVIETISKILHAYNLRLILDETSVRETIIKVEKF